MFKQLTSFFKLVARPTKNGLIESVKKEKTKDDN